MVRYFAIDPKPSIKVKIDQKATQLDDCEELVAKVVKVKVKEAYNRVSMYERLITIIFKKIGLFILPLTRSKVKI